MRRGLTLTETVMALLMLAFAVAVFGAAFPTAANAISKNRHSDIATDAAYREIEAWRTGYRQGQTPYTEPYDDGVAPLLATGNGATYSTNSSADFRVPLPATTELPSATKRISLRRIDSGAWPAITATSHTATATYDAVTNPVTNTASTNFRAQIDVTVTWTGVGSDKGSVTVSSLLTDRP